jgi:hypothetical protein
MAVLALGSGTHFAAKLVRDEVQTVANAEHGQPQRKNAIVGGRSVMIVDGRWASAQNDAGRAVALNLIQWGGTGEDNGKYFEFADAARNELRVLRAEVENDDGLFFHEQLFLIRGSV